jgi:CYTH domain-containing protein
MNKTYQTEFRRLFLINDLPEPLTRADAHLQIFDNYIENTRLRLRRVRVPQTRENAWLMEHRFPADENNLAIWKIAEVFLHEDEYKIFEQFEGREIRKNRYFYELDGKSISLDVYLGNLWGLNMARINFETEEEMEHFEAPPFAVFEVTNDKFFSGENLVGKTFTDVRSEFEKISSIHQVILEVQDE